MNSIVVHCYLLLSDSAGAMLNIVQDSALLEAIGCQMETVSTFCLWSYFFRKNAFLTLPATERGSGSILRFDLLYLRAWRTQEIFSSLNCFSLCRMVVKTTSSKATVVQIVALALQAVAAQSPRHLTVSGQHRPSWGIMVRIALWKTLSWCARLMFSSFSVLVLAKALMCPGVWS